MYDRLREGMIHRPFLCLSAPLRGDWRRRVEVLSENVRQRGMGQGRAGETYMHYVYPCDCCARFDFDLLHLLAGLWARRDFELWNQTGLEGKGAAAVG
jgi:hypothetical protein